MERSILHVDMNNCYASIEVKMHPQWKGIPLAVCGSVDERHGIVLAKSQEAKERGVQTGEAIWQAKQKCPSLLVVPPHYDAYLEHSRMARKIYYSYTNRVEPFGLDECWLDVTGSKNLHGTGEEIAQLIRQRIKKELGITVSVGVSYNKIFAKLGSDLKKPDAVTVIRREDLHQTVWPLPTKELLGVGPATKQKLKKRGIDTIGQLAKTDPHLLKTWLGIPGVHLWHYANGRDEAPVMDADQKPPIKSIGHGITCTADLVDDIEVRRVFTELAFDVSSRLRKAKLSAQGVQISVRDSDLITVQYQGPLPLPTQSPSLLTKTGFELFQTNYPWKKSIRSLTIRAINLVSASLPRQSDCFSDFETLHKKEKVDEVMYQIREKFGSTSISFAGLLQLNKFPGKRQHMVTLPSAYIHQG
ncbi:MAG: DNA polymerase IV [Tissierellia bacterium]|nr:DNA polymerase IV [Tissierellia bacterium]